MSQQDKDWESRQSCAEIFPSPTLTYEVGIGSDRGKGRVKNEDSVLAAQHVWYQEDRMQSSGLFVLADGIGGYVDGQEASSLSKKSSKMKHEERKAMEPINVFEYEAAARTKMEPAYWDYFAGGSDDELTMQACRDAFARVRLRPRVLVDVSCCDTTTSILGSSVHAPILVAPTAFHCMAHPEGETATARGAGAAGSLMIASTDATCSLEEVAQVATGPLWFQLYLYPTREIAAGLVRRAEVAGYKAIVLTVDLPVLGNRERDRRHGLTIPPVGMDRANFAGIDVHGYAWNTITWSDLEWLCALTKLPVLVKGILTAEDAVQALAYGVAGIVVSNHGGRQLDGSIPALEALPEVVEAVAGRCTVLVDGGVRRGTDVLKALALGAQAVLVGRPILWGLAAEGAEGVQRVLEILSGELEQAMKLSGCPTVNDIHRGLVKGI